MNGQSLAQLNISVLGKTISSFTFMWITGVLLAQINTSFWFYYLSLNWLLFPVIFITTSLAFLITAFIIKIVSGKEYHVMMRYLIAALLLNAIVMNVLSEAVNAYLDVIVLGYAIVICLGRIGCFMAGCCHGRLHLFGIYYSQQHVEKGLASYYRNEKIFPIQLLESAFLLFIIGICSLLLISTKQSGIAWVSFLLFYSLIRFVLEFFRGDHDRKFYLGFSEAQWTALFFALLLSVGAFAHLFSLYWFHLVTGMLIISSFSIVVIIRRRYPELRINDTLHVHELYTYAHKLLYAKNNELKMYTTKQGINISGSSVNADTFHFTLSVSNQRRGTQCLDKAVGVMLKLKNVFEDATVKKGNAVIHIIIKSDR